MNRREMKLIQKNQSPVRRVLKKAFRQGAKLAVAGIMAVSLGCGAAQPKTAKIAGAAQTPAAAEPEKEGSAVGETNVQLDEKNPYLKTEKDLKPKLLDDPY